MILRNFDVDVFLIPVNLLNKNKNSVYLSTDIVDLCIDRCQGHRMFTSMSFLRQVVSSKVDPSHYHGSVFSS